MKAKIIAISAVRGLMFGLVVGYPIALKYADEHPYLLAGDNAIGIPILAGMISIGAVAIGASIGNIIADNKRKDRTK